MPHLTLALFGPPRITLDDAPITAFKTQKAKALLIFLAVEMAHAHRRESLTGLLWSDQTEPAARNSLRVSLHRLRQALREVAPATKKSPAPFLLISHENIQFNPDSDYSMDVSSFNALLDSTRAHRHNRVEMCQPCNEQLTQGVTYYRGDFLAGFTLSASPTFEEWVLVQREKLREQALSALELLTTYHAARREYAPMCQSARRQIELEPWRESAHRQLMRGLALSGDRNAALAQYETCRRLLTQELGIEPDAETRALYEHIKDEDGTLRVKAETSNFTRSVHPSSFKNNLPAPLTPFIGREKELEEITARLDQPECRLLTLVGLGGMGKTRLALQVAAARMDAFPQGVYFVSLAPLNSASAILPTIAGTLGLDLISGRETKEQLFSYLRERRVLLLLDNLEHLLSSSTSLTAFGSVEGLNGAIFISELLRAAPEVQVIVTSRERLRLQGEQIFNVSGLDYDSRATLEQAATFSAVRLFLSSAHREHPKLMLTEENLPDVLRICRLVEGMPLGLELAAAWTELLPLSEIVVEIERNASFLETERRDVPARQLSLQAVFEWSWQLLGDAERAVLAQLSVFRGGFTREAAEKVASASLRVLTTLMHKSLLRWGSTSHHEMHELLRQYAAARLDQSPEVREQARERHSSFYLALIAEHEAPLLGGETQRAVAVLQREIDNIRAAWEYAAKHARLAELDASAQGLAQFYVLQGLPQEGENAFALAAENLQGVEPNAQELLSRLLGEQARFVNLQAKYNQAIDVAQEAVTRGQGAGQIAGYLQWGYALMRTSRFDAARHRLDQAITFARAQHADTRRIESLRVMEAEAQSHLGNIAWNQGDYARAREDCEQALRLFRELGDRRGESLVLNTLGLIASELGDYAVARVRFQESLSLCREIGNRLIESSALLNLGIALRDQCNFAQAEDAFRQALRIKLDIGDPWGAAHVRLNLGYTYDRQGDYLRARDHIEESLRKFRELGARRGEAQARMYLGLIEHHLTDDERAYAESKQGLQIAEEIGHRFARANALTNLAHACVGLGRFDEAADAYRQSLQSWRELAIPYCATEPLAGLARVAMARGHLAEAQAHVEEITQFLQDHTLDGTDEPFRVYLTCYQVLRAAGDPRASELLKTAHDLLQARADKIQDENLRRSFLENVMAHRELVKMDDAPSALAT